MSAAAMHDTYKAAQAAYESARRAADTAACVVAAQADRAVRGKTKEERHEGRGTLRFGLRRWREAESIAEAAWAERQRAVKAWEVALANEGAAAIERGAIRS